MSVSCGIDFGTSNSALALNTDGDVQLIPVDRVNENVHSLKSVLYFYKDEDGTEQIFSGEKAIQEYIFNEAEGRYMQSIKTFLPDSSFSDTQIYKRTYKLDDLIAIILKKLKKKGEMACSASLEDVVLGRPVQFSSDKEKDKKAENRLRMAAVKAGFKNIDFMFEPVAAALSYEATLNMNEEKTILVGDFGGGTSDFTIIRLLGGKGYTKDRKNDILSVGGVYIGGNDFDSDLMWDRAGPWLGKNALAPTVLGGEKSGISSFIMSKLRRWHLIPQLKSPAILRSLREFRHFANQYDRRHVMNLEVLIKKNLGLNLFRSIEKTKCHLTDSENATISFYDSGIRINENVKKSEFESLISHRVEGLAVCVDRTLMDAGVTNLNIDSVFLTGGTSQIPLLRAYFSNRFGEDNVHQTDAFTSVAFGLGIAAQKFQRKSLI